MATKQPEPKALFAKGPTKGTKINTKKTNSKGNVKAKLSSSYTKGKCSM